MMGPEGGHWNSNLDLNNNQGLTVKLKGFHRFSILRRNRLEFELF